MVKTSIIGRRLFKNRKRKDCWVGRGWKFLACFAVIDFNKGDFAEQNYRCPQMKTK